jgi:hypothetical protein
MLPSDPVQTRSKCPKCGERLCFRDSQDPLCMACDTPVHLSWSYRRYTACLSLLVVALIGFVTYRPSSDGRWVLGLVLFWPLLTVVFWTILPQRYEQSYSQPKVTFPVAFLAVFVSVFAVEFVGFGMAYVILGAPSSEISELLEMLSMPLAWVHHQFLITPEKSFLDVCGVIAGNSLLLGLPVFACVKVVQAAFRQNRVTQIGIGGVTDDSDD